MTLRLDKHEVNLWRASLRITPEQERTLWSLLSKDERERADRLRLPLHRKRYIASRGILRCILSDYLGVPAADICFLYNHRNKPYLLNSHLQFNLSHSDAMAVYALTTDYAIGVDIEKMGEVDETNIAKRFFSVSESQALMALPPEERVKAFYRLWSRKEALIKALGEGFAFPLANFSVSLEPTKEQVTLPFNGSSTWHLESFAAAPGYQSAFATAQPVEKIRFCDWNKIK